MQSFKEFLIENVGHAVYHIIDVTSDKVVIAPTFVRIKNALQQKISYLKWSIERDQDVSTVSIKAPDANYVYGCQDVFDDIAEAFENVISIDIAHQHIVTIWPPMFPIDFPDNVHLQLGPESPSLKGIEKLIKKAEILVIEHPANFKGGLLNVLKLKNVNTIEFEQAISILEYNKATDIVIKHFEKGKDILACQEELIEAGLKDYAKL